MPAGPFRLMVVSMLGCGGAVMISRGAEQGATGASPVQAAELSVASGSATEVADETDETDGADVIDPLEPELEVHPLEPLPRAEAVPRWVYPQTPPKPGDACHAALRA